MRAALTRLGILVLLLGFAAPIAVAADGKVVVSRVGAHAAGGSMIDIYGSFLNQDSVDDHLTGASSPLLGHSVRLMRRERRVEIADILPLALPSGRSVRLAPRKEFLRFYDVRKLPKSGDSFPVTFRFSHASAITVEVSMRGEEKP
jgi:copper(I)-binding protein